MEDAKDVTAIVMGLQMLENVIPLASVTVNMVLKEKHVTIVRMDTMESIANLVAVIQMVLIWAKIQNVIPILVNVNVGLASKETNVINVMKNIIGQALYVLDVVAMEEEVEMEENVILMAPVHASMIIQGKNVIPAKMDFTKEGLYV